MTDKVTHKDALDAIQYLWGTGATLQMRSDDRQYTEILIKYAADRMNIELG
jgi:hypothetical protein